MVWWRAKSETGRPAGGAKPASWRPLRSPFAKLTAALLAAAYLGGGGWWLWQSGWLGRLSGSVGAELADLTADAGLRVGDVLVVGRKETPRHALLDALAVERGAPILSIDLHAARARLLALPWVSSVTVERMLPDTIVVRITERRPVAIWQRHGQFSLIDASGQVIAGVPGGNLGELLLVVGDEAPPHAAALLEMLASEPELAPAVKAAVRVGGRRWNLHLANGIDVRLPEERMAEAWARLADYQRRHGLLDKPIRSLDMRFYDRLIVQPRPDPPAEKDAAGNPA
jgi:cell division protein FtsQ